MSIKPLKSALLLIIFMTVAFISSGCGCNERVEEQDKAAKRREAPRALEKAQPVPGERIEYTQSAPEAPAPSPAGLRGTTTADRKKAAGAAHAEAELKGIGALNEGQALNGTAKAERSAKPNAPKAGGEAGRGASQPFWVVEKFKEKTDWLKPHPDLAALGRDWGSELTKRLRKKLLERSLTVESVSKKLDYNEISRLVSEGMKYLCGGELESLAAVKDDEKTAAEFVVVYELRRSSGEKVHLVQKNRLEFSHPVTGDKIGEADLEALLDKSAETIAERVAEHIPSDLAASRG